MDAVRASLLAVVALAAALIGGVGSLAVAHTSGWLDDTSGSKTRTVVVTSADAPNNPSPATLHSSAKPLVGNGFDPQRLFAERSAGVVTIYAYFGSGDAAQAAQGSGFVVSPEGYVLTNSHVITDAGGGTTNGSPAVAASQIYVEFSDRDRVPARVVGWDVFDDVGLLKVSPSDHALAPVPLGDSDALAVGEPVAAIGSPLGNENSLTVGVVSAHRAIGSLTSQFDVVDAIQTDAAITHGNSGGPLFDARGEVVGINAQIRPDATGADTGIGFAIPINSAKRSMRQLIDQGHVTYAFIGIETGDLTPSIAHRFHLGAEHGALVTSVRDGTPAARAGLHGPTGRQTFEGSVVPTGGDAIVAIGGRPVSAADDVVRIVASLTPGQTIPFTVVRGRKKRVVPIRLGVRQVTQ
ncbi:MAG: hypothetical protein QOE36_3313 [Gaiellaceae bacterium]|nr:hypothetical protein [Gaiellaceae bacterium]